MADKVIQIKRYPNRRFYSRNTSKYVSLQDIEEMIREGHTVEVIDSQSGESLTRVVLTQIILDRQPEKMSLFPVDMLHSIVRSNDMVAGFLRDYFRNSLTYLDYLQQHGATAKNLTSPIHWAKAWLDGLQTSGGEASGAEAAEQPWASRIEELEQRIRQLEANRSVSAVANGSSGPP